MTIPVFLLTTSCAAPLLQRVKHKNIVVSLYNYCSSRIKCPDRVLNSKHRLFLISSGSGPNVLKIKTMEGDDGKPLNIVQEIAAGDYMTFGMCLLQDENGHEVDILRKDNISEGAEAITQSILKKWLTSGSAPTRTYQHLMECLRKCKLCTLADNIADATGDYQHTAKPNNKCQLKYSCTKTVGSSLLALHKRVMCLGVCVRVVCVRVCVCVHMCALEHLTHCLLNSIHGYITHILDIYLLHCLLNMYPVALE